MSEIAKKYGMDDTKFRMAINDGLISTSWIRKEEIVIHYKAKCKEYEKTEAVKVTSDYFNVSPQYVYNLLRENVFK